MNPEPPLTRRDVVALVVYAVLIRNVLGPLLNVIAMGMSARFLPSVSPWGGRTAFYWVDVISNIAVSLALLPFVSLIVNGVAGRNLSLRMTVKGVLPLLISLVGLIVFLTEFPQIFSGIYYYWRAADFYGASYAATARPAFIQNIVVVSAGVSLGFALAFCPNIFSTLRARIRDEETAG